MKKYPVSLALLLFTLLLLGGCATSRSEKPELQGVNRPIPTYGGRVFANEQVSVQPIPIRQRRPVYPLELRKRGISGEAVISFVVRSDGSVSDATIVKATDVRFGDAAAACVSEWQFRPAQVNGTPVACHMMVPIVFSLN